MIVLGIDPDLHHTGLALADEHRVYGVAIVEAGNKPKLTGEEAVLAMTQQLVIGGLGPLLYRTVADFGLSSFRVVVEGQQLYLGGDAPKAKPEDLINLAFVAGAAMQAARSVADILKLEIGAMRYPTPGEWKGQVPKKIHQTRTCAKLGWQLVQQRSDYVVPIFPVFHEQAFQERLDAIVENRASPKPAGADKLKPSDWKHVMDAIGLARWGASQFK